MLLLKTLLPATIMRVTLFSLNIVQITAIVSIYYE